MEWLNYHHLFYFWTAVREGGVSRAAAKLWFSQPTGDTALRRSPDLWFETEGLRPMIVGEFEDPALLNVFGEHGRAAFPAPTAIEREICRS